MKIVFLSFKSLIDRDSGAALELKTVMEFLAANGDTCSSYCINCYDVGENYTHDEEIRKGSSQKVLPGQVFKYISKGISHHLYVGVSKDTRNLTSDDLRNYIKLTKAYLDQEKPDLVIFFGSKEMMPILETAYAIGAKIAFYLGSAALVESHKPLIEISDHLVVPSKFIGDHYQRMFGKLCVKINTSLPFTPVSFGDIDYTTRQNYGFVTLVNPTPDKGGHIFMAMSQRFKNENRLFLCIESRGKRSFWRKSGIKVDHFENLLWAPWQSDIRKLLRRSALLVMPSLVNEAAGKVISEAMALGVPCLGYDVGGIKEQIGLGGRTLRFDSVLASDKVTGSYTSRVPKGPIDDWEKEIRDILSDKEEYENLSKAALTEANRFLIERTAMTWRELGTPSSNL
ncbi:glycosyltransferase family 4 protein [Roseinatronobacter monicus]|uniref:Glycosyltransferase involved in cell wall biosynthesis n=1 Tax=Roseinatronobacter monicus TaxID=393481 RepID=A0A543K488_9RHOB|nr:glycosyltransferase family 4 protein [Roseinatronobacter monicus]TQM89903.1 glycosyltransferase involved in cell wall biosynthesis [Roseinatronobacter monicus]